ncbi:MAG: sugar phosphate isomerase/epimerase family protein [Syntrophomonadaceae bacterium]
MNRRNFIKQSVFLTGSLSVFGFAGNAFSASFAKSSIKISLAEWSLHRALFSGKLDHLDFPREAKHKYGIKGVEYVNQFFKSAEKPYITELKKRAEDNGVKSLLIMCDNEGSLGDPDEKKRIQTVENHYKWVEAAETLGCHSIRVNAASQGSYDEQMKLASDGLHRLCLFAGERKINVIVENHGGLSSNGQWLTSVIKMADHPRAGTLPDLGNFKISDTELYDRYKGISEMLPYAKSVSAKSYDFDKEGNETTIDFARVAEILKKAGYKGYLGIEYEGDRLAEPEGIMATKKLIERFL